MKILILGAGGMLGYTAYRLLHNLSHEVTGVTKTRRRDGLICLDATEEHSLSDLLRSTRPDVIVNCAALLAEPSEEHKNEAVRLNAWLPHYLEEYCDTHHAYLVQVSTDGVFSGKVGRYVEKSPSDTDTFYGKSKYLGEVYGENALTIRSAFWGADADPQGKGLFQWFLRQRGQVNGFTKAFFNGVSNLEFARFVERAIEERWTGICHLCAKVKISKFDFLCLQKEVFKTNVQIVPSESLSIDRSLICTRGDIPYESKTFEKMMEEQREWKAKLGLPFEIK